MTSNATAITNRRYEKKRECERFDRMQFISFVCQCAVSVFIAIYLELFYECCDYGALGPSNGILAGSISTFVIMRLCTLFAISLLFSWLLFRIPHKYSDFIFRRRYLLAFLVLLILIIFEINFSSLGMWAEILNSGNDKGLLFGVSRSIRSDEFNVSALFNISQEHNEYRAWTDIIRGDLTDTRLVYNAPSWSIATIFRPFLWGYLILGSAKGLSFYWTVRLFAIFFASFEFMRLLTSDNRAISLFFAVTTTLSPIVQWWGYWDGIIFGAFLVVTLHRYLHSQNIIQATLFSSILAWLCGCYILILYPAWMVPFFFIYAIIGLTILHQFVISQRSTPSYRAIYILPLLIAIILIAAAVFAVFYQSSDALEATTSTVYPGARFETGGGGLMLMLNYGNSILFPISQPAYSNACEMSSIFSLFPLGTSLAIFVLIKYRNVRLLPLVVLQLVFLTYLSIGFPSIIAKLTLFSYTPTSRMVFAAGYLELLLFSVSMKELLTQKCVAAHCTLKVRLLIAIGAGVTSLFVFRILFNGALPGYSRTIFTILVLLVIAIFACAVLLAFLSNQTYLTTRLLLLGALGVVAVSGLCINPIRSGIEPITENDLAIAVSDIVSNDGDAKWIVEDSWSLSNLLTALGAPTVGSTNMYPDHKIWNSLDPEGKYSDIYNRYAHVNIHLGAESTSFELNQGDLITLNLSYEDLANLDIEYLVTYRDLSCDNESISLTAVTRIHNYIIYRIDSRHSE